MNKERRKALSDAIVKLEAAKGILDEAKTIVEISNEDEQAAYDGLPESLQEGERGDMMQENIDSLDEAYSSLDEISDTIDEAINSIQEAIDR